MIIFTRLFHSSILLGFLVSALSAQLESIAVLDLDGRGISSMEAASLTDRLRSELVRSGRITVVERGQMEQVLAEQDFQMAGCTSDECAVEVGQLLGVTEMVAGSIGKVGSTFSLDIRIINVANGVISNSIIRDYRGEIDGLLAEMRVLAGDLAVLLSTVVEAEPPPPATMSIITEPVGAQVVLNGAVIDNTPISTLDLEPDKLQSIAVSLAGYKSVDTTFITTAGQHHELSWTLVPLKSWLTVITSPPGATTVLSGSSIGSTPINQYELEPGKSYDLIVHLRGYMRVDTTITAIPDLHTRLNLPLQRVPVATTPPVQSRVQPSVRPKGKGRWIVMAVIMAAGGYYGYTEGWFSGADGAERPTVGQPPGVPVQ